MNDIILKLSKTIKDRRGSLPDKSYTAFLLNSGTDKCSKKFGEEAIELIVAASKNDLNAFHHEAADVLYHLLVLIESKRADFNQILSILSERQVQSGHTEKARRKL